MFGINGNTNNIYVCAAAAPAPSVRQHFNLNISFAARQ